MIASLQNQSVTPEGWITHQATPEQLLEHFASWLKPETGVIKAMLEL